jgi:hypothetical protein
MLSTLTAPGKDGKQSKNFDRNTRKVTFIEILLRAALIIIWMFA